MIFSSNLMNSFITLCCLWWIVLFIILPIGVKKDPSPQLGCEPGAPQEPRIKQKLLLVTGITLILFFLLIIL